MLQISIKYFLYFACLHSFSYGQIETEPIDGENASYEKNLCEMSFDEANYKDLRVDKKDKATDKAKLHS